jgi:hypothetical protein
MGLLNHFTFTSRSLEIEPWMSLGMDFSFHDSLHPLTAFPSPIFTSLKSNKATKASRAVIILVAACVRCLRDFVVPTVFCSIVSVAVLEHDAVTTLAIVVVSYFSTHRCSALAGCRCGSVKGVRCAQWKVARSVEETEGPRLSINKQRINWCA